MCLWVVVAGCHLRRHDARGHRIDPDAALLGVGKLVGNELGEVGRAGLGGIVGVVHLALLDKGGDARCGNDCGRISFATVGLLLTLLRAFGQEGQEGDGKEKEGVGVEAKELLPVLEAVGLPDPLLVLLGVHGLVLLGGICLSIRRGGVSAKVHGSSTSGVGDEDVQAVFLLGEVLDGLLDGVLLGDVGGDETGEAILFHDVFEDLFSSREDVDLCAGSSKALRLCQPDAWCDEEVSSAGKECERLDLAEGGVEEG